MGHKKQNQTSDEAARDREIQERKELKATLYSNCFYTAAKAISNLHDYGHALDCSTFPKNFENSKKVANELLEIKHEQRLDTRTAA